jgi:hypothetical protein
LGTIFLQPFIIYRDFGDDLWHKRVYHIDGLSSRKLRVCWSGTIHLRDDSVNNDGNTSTINKMMLENAQKAKSNTFEASNQFTVVSASADIQ